MLFRLLPFFLILLLPMAAAGHVDGHSHFSSSGGPHTHDEAAATVADQRTAPPLQTALVAPGSLAPGCGNQLATLLAGQQTLQEELQRLGRELSALRVADRQPDMAGIMGGFGYILGFCGLYAWVRSRRSKS